MAQSKLEEVAIGIRKDLVTKNYYNDSDINQNYSATHKNALSDGDMRGKGTGGSFDSSNGGGLYDIYGVPHAAGSGRIANVAFNQYNADNTYIHPDTEGNIGQVTL